MYFLKVYRLAVDAKPGYLCVNFKSFFMKTTFVSRFFILMLVSLLVTSCYDDDVLNGVVEIDIQQSPMHKMLVDLSSGNDSIRIRFTTHTELKEVGVLLYEENASKFIIEDQRVMLKEYSCLSGFAPEERIILNYQNSTVEGKEFTYTGTVDLSSYPEGSCFALFGSGEGVSRYSEGGTDHNGIYFCKKNAN